MIFLALGFGGIGVGILVFYILNFQYYWNHDPVQLFVAGLIYLVFTVISAILAGKALGDASHHYPQKGD